MRNHTLSSISSTFSSNFRILLPLAGLTVGFLMNAPIASAQQPEGPGPEPRQGNQGGQRGPGGPRPEGPGRPGLPVGFVPGDYLAQYLGLSGAQQQKLTNLMKTMDALNRENAAPTAFKLLKLSEEEMRRIAAGDKVTDVLTSDQLQTLNANRRPARRGSEGQGAPGRPGGPDGFQGQGRPEGPGGPDGPPPPPPTGEEREGSAPTPVATQPLAAGVVRVPVVFSGGHDTDPRDGGRPVVLVANALGVAPEVFREAFSHVRPAQAGSAPEPAQVQQNKAALLNALGKYGIDNDRLDTVSNYYRYVRSRGELWTHTSAVANALIKNGAVVGFEIVRPGAGYTTPPTVTIPNVRGGSIVVKLAFGKNLTTNGSITAITASQN